ncbi:MAG: NADP-dependent isocitrate dehydrogenase, partial [Candidatus Tectomicrobia bacterium]|nr:NADP-dependent isocitrate dehydrogenase [Candidatus Tectomicrobia bacterium]
MAEHLDIIYTTVDEAPELASASFLPIIQAFTKPSGIRVGTKDISLAGRIISQFPERLTPAQQQPDDLALLGQLVEEPEANVIKLPNISASIPQMKGAIAELQTQGYNVPDYPEEPQNDQERDYKARYDRVKGSAVNPVLRQGNSDRRASASVKQYAKNNPHSMGKWTQDSQTHIAHMTGGDFYANEKSVMVTAPMAGTGRIEFVADNGGVTVLKASHPLQVGDIVDATMMSCTALRQYLQEQIADAKKSGILLSLHLKATMMKVSDPIIFGHAVTVYFADLFHKYGQVFKDIGVDPDNGVGDILAKIQTLPAVQKEAIEADLQAALQAGPPLAMVDSNRGITNLHVPSDVIIDASVAAALRIGGKMWGPDGGEYDTKALVPDRSYAGIYQAVIDFCKENGEFNPATMGTVPNVGLMAQQAEEYGSHDQTFTAPSKGVIRVLDGAGNAMLQHSVETGDLWRMCLTTDVAIKDWVKLAVNRSRISGMPVVFWLDPQRGHDAQVIQKVQQYLPEHDTDGLDIKTMAPVEAMKHSLQRAKDGLDTISATGNVLRDYLTDLFPILELGTSAKMLSIVPLINGGAMFETGAGGSAPRHVQQFVREGHLRWDSLGEFMALAESFAHLSRTTGNKQAQ